MARYFNSAWFFRRDLAVSKASEIFLWKSEIFRFLKSALKSHIIAQTIFHHHLPIIWRFENFCHSAVKRRRSKHCCSLFVLYHCTNKRVGFNLLCALSASLYHRISQTYFILLLRREGKIKSHYWRAGFKHREKMFRFIELREASFLSSFFRKS